MKNTVKILIVVLACMAVASLLVGCQKNNNGNIGGEESEHNYGEWVVYKEATCETAGYKSRICKDCGASQTEKTEALGHDYEENVISLPTCEKAGQSEFVCKRDSSHHYMATVDALGHDWEEGTGYTAPTCTDPGYSASAKCKRCSETRAAQTLPALGHDYGIKKTVKEATCTEAGEEQCECARCGDKVTNELPALGHDYSTKKTITEPTCTEAGEEQCECARCGDKVTEEIPALDHDWEMGDIVKPATCTEPGESASAKCKRCGETQGKTEIPALGHDYTGGTFYESYSTCTTPGKAHRNCRRCSYYENITLPLAEHEYTTPHYVNNKKPTCTEGTRVKYACRWCNKEKEEEDVQALGHDWEENKITQAPNCTEPGIGVHTCLRCHTEEEYTLDAVGHLFKDKKVTNAATESATGTAVDVCIRCGALGTNQTTIPIPNGEVEYEIRLIRTTGRDYQYPTEVQFNIYKANGETQKFHAGGIVTKIKLSKDVKKLTVEGLRGGFKTDKTEYDLDPCEPFVTIMLSAAVREESRGGTDNREKIPTEDLIDLGEPVYDFLVRDCKNPYDYSKDKWFSEILKEKKLIMFDFMWSGCSSCSALMEQFLQAYNKKLMPYKDQIQVILVDVMVDEDRNRIKNFVEGKHYPDEFIACVGNENNVFSFYRWFDIEKNNMKAPPNVMFVDNEGVVIKINGINDSQGFEKFVLDYFKNYVKPTSNGTKTAETASLSADENKASPALTDIFCEPLKRRKF